ncbi:MAG TPA: hypothetical protein DCP03_21375 [Polaromonas sp.]|uniref:zeta toxin family protein n=1 Tax=Polaromonas sp. UBA4122 TaxID=1947074 RepID=UPI000ECCA633|nr:zeta toxin family protein [Polaromonas sp. UBA4122]HAL40503.1 hypothetical protein [Polaromonas sp.]
MGQVAPIPQRQDTHKPVFYLLAGPNGAGKSTLYKALVLAGTIPSSAEFVNADLYEAAHLQHVTDVQARSEQARLWADSRRAELVSTGLSFVSETVFSHVSKLTLIEEAQAQGFFVMLLVVALDQPQRLLARVAQRVAEGGHPVPADRILGRYCCGLVQRDLDEGTGTATAPVGAASSLGMKSGFSARTHCARSYCFDSEFSSHVR